MDHSLLVDFYELTMAGCYLHHRKGAFATFDLFVRQMPCHRSYLLACGLTDVLEYLKNLRFTKKDIAYLRSRARRDLNKFPKALNTVSSDYHYPVEISPGLARLTKDILA
jgi:nicotinate phosphoribosyltransferase